MDTVTHAVVGYAIVKSGLASDTGRWATAAGVSTALFPDIDGLLGVFLGTDFIVEYHRSLTNSIFLVVPFSLVFAWLFVKISKLRLFWTFFTLSAVEIITHTLLDVMTSYGTMILSPVSDKRFALDWVFIVDLIFTGTFVVSTIVSLFWRCQERILARSALIIAAAYIGICALNHSWANAVASSDAREKGLRPQATVSLPQPLSPFHWANYLVTDGKIYEGFVDLLGINLQLLGASENWLDELRARYQPIDRLEYLEWQKLDDSIWVRTALSFGGVRKYLKFARLPIGRHRMTEGYHQVSFFDLRFGVINGKRPFIYQIHFDIDGNVIFAGYAQRYLTDLD